jgi:hypothetical protein
MSIAERDQIPEIPVEDPEGFVHRKPASSKYEQVGIERRQFPNAGVRLSPAAQELERAIDIYKMTHGIRRINVEQLLMLMTALGYVRNQAAHSAARDD